MKIEKAKGTKDTPPEEEIVKQEILDKLKETFRLYGFSPLETPILERIETLTAKYAGGSEILKEVFKLKDQGGRKIGLRYDLTVPLSRFVATNPSLKFPFKRYQLGVVFRDGPIKLGRYREFWQCDADIVGSKNMTSDLECVQLAFDFFKRLGIKAFIEINNRKVLDGIMDSLEIPEKERNGIIITIDKLKKISINDIKKELKQKGMYEKQIEKLMDILDIEGSNKEKIKKLRKIMQSEKGKQGLDELENIFQYVNTKELIFNIALARGLDYYTGTVFEAFTKDLKSSIAGGGRYDNMIGGFMGKEQVPAVGISFGIDTIIDTLKLKKKIESKKTVTKAFIIPIGIEKEAIKLAESLRNQGINTETDLMSRGISKNLDYANSLKIPFVIFLGKKELEKNKFNLRDMETGKERLLDETNLIKNLKKN